MRASTLAAFVASAGTVLAQQQAYLGFNSGATKDDGTVKRQADFESEFTAQAKLNGAPGVFNSVRLYTNIQANTNNQQPIEAFAAAIKTNTKMLLGMWTSGTSTIDPELAALSKAISTYGKNFTNLVVGISVGSEDLYRSSADGVANKAGVGQDASTISNFIQATRNALKNTDLAKTPVGHVDTWTAWVNGSNKAVIDASDFLGVDLYPYYENGNNINMSNNISNALALFQTALNRTKDAAGSKPLWVTETGWPVTGPTWNSAVPSTDNAQQYWDTVGCSLFGKMNTWWYTLRDSNPDNTMKFGLNPKLDGNPLYNLTCPAVKDSQQSSNGGNSSSNNGSSSNGTSSTASPTASLSPSGTGAAAAAGKSAAASGSAAATTGSNGASMLQMSSAALGAVFMVAVFAF